MSAAGTETYINAAAKFTKTDLIEMQAYPLVTKIGRTQARLIEWFIRWDQKVYVSFSGGKDSTVLADLAARICKASGWTLYLLFVDTGLEYPEIRQFVPFFAQWLREKYEIEVELDVRRQVDKRKKPMPFNRVVQCKGYPLISKEVSHVVHGGRRGQPSCLRKLNGEKRDHAGEKSKYNCEKWQYLLDAPFEISDECCEVMKKRPAKRYEKETGRYMITAEMAEEGQLRQSAWLLNGCNGFDLKRPKSTPMAFWTEQDVLKYLTMTGIPYAPVYGQIVPQDSQMTLFEEGCKLKTTGCDRTGCMFCGFGLTKEKDENRFQKMKKTHPPLYKYCMEEPRLIDAATGEEMFADQKYKMGIIYELRRELGDSEFDRRYKVLGGLGMANVLEYLGLPY